MQSAAYNFVLNRDKLAPNEIDKNTIEVDLPKCRQGKTGPAGKWYYDFSTVKMYDLNDWLELSSKTDTPETENEQRKAPF